ncbi:leucine--tRNA ligase [bacterium NHP-B]|nr:leucine--tRNA ligase [bacterium NHP-B]
MTSKYNFHDVEAHWQKTWADRHAFAVADVPDSKAMYVLEMFPYPSGKIHVGHARNYVLGDVMARHQRALGKKVLHPIGWDAFGLPAENAAFKHGVHPQEWTYKNAADMAENLKKLGLSYDWSREIFSCDPSYYVHEQKMFLRFLSAGLVERKTSYVNWDPVEKTVLANEQVIDGRGWRSGALVEKKPLKQWFLKITSFKEDLLQGLDTLTQWPEKVKTMQRNWIGRSEGAKIFFPLKNTQKKIEVFTTRPDTLFGASFLGLSPDHPLAKKLGEEHEDIASFLRWCQQHNTAAMSQEIVEKRAIKTPLEVHHPLLPDQTLPVYIVSYVMMDYGTGAVFGCPAHDARDFDIAKQKGLPILPVIKPKAQPHDFETSAYEGDGELMASSFLDGLDVASAKKAMIQQLEERGCGRKDVSWRLRDWGVSRQRYWGCPIPMIHCQSCGAVPVPEEDLPVKLPEDVSFDVPGNPLDHHPTWKHVACPQCGKHAVRETDTLDTFFDSSWYFLRFCSPSFPEAFNPDAVKQWMPVAHYIGGVEHAILHLLYARFFMHALKKAGYPLSFTEPFTGLFNQGMVVHRTFQDDQGEWHYPTEAHRNSDGTWVHSQKGVPLTVGRLEKMSKSKCNVVSIDDIVKEVGADATRFFLLSDTPPEKDMEWTKEGIEGSWRHIARVWRLFTQHAPDIHKGKNALKASPQAVYGESAKHLLRTYHQGISAIDDTLTHLHFNKYVANLYKIVGAMASFSCEEAQDERVLYNVWVGFVKLMAPVTPHLAEALWTKMGEQGFVHESPWPEAEEKWLSKETLSMPVQMNGKTKGQIDVPMDAEREVVEKILTQTPWVDKALHEREVRKIIFVKNRIINVVLA